MSILISAEEVFKKINKSNLVIVDCRFNMSNASEGRLMYKQNHIPGAVYFDLDKDLSRSVTKHGGRHPLPEMNMLIEKLGKAGIDESTEIVVYDDQDGSFAARFWWMLEYLGNDNVSVLNVPYSKWEKLRYPTTKKTPHPRRKFFVPNIREEMIVDIETLKKNKEEDDYVLIDSRDPERYRGEVEPIDQKAGHIPGARNVFLKKTL